MTLDVDAPALPLDPRSTNAYERAGATLLAESGCEVVRWRTHSTGIAWLAADRWMIEAPRPRGPVSFGVFAHEVGHQMLHRGRGSRSRWQKEIEAWEWALDCFARFELPRVERARLDAVRSLSWVAHASARHAKPGTARAIRARYEWVFAAAAEFAEQGETVQHAALALFTLGRKMRALR